MRIIMTCLFIVAMSGVGAWAAEVRTFSIDPAEGQDAPYVVRVDGKTVPLERAGSGDNHTVYYARYYGVEQAEVEVKVADAGRIEASVGPDRLAENVRIEGDSIRFAAQGIGPVIVLMKAGGKQLPHLFVICEPVEENPPRPGDENVLNVADHGVVAGKDAPQTEALQKVLDACARRPGGGVVYVPAGHYYTGTLHVRDNTYLYLAAGAVLQAWPEPDHFPLIGGDQEHGGNGKYHSFSRLLFFDRAHNARLGGRGTLDASGHILRNKFQRRVHVIEAHEGENIRIDGVVARNSASWSVHLLKCDGVHVSDVKVIADWNVSNCDGFDPDSCRNVLIERAFCYTGDDSFAVKSTNNSGLLQPTCNITIRDSVVMTLKTALKVGTETFADMSNILYENIDVCYSSRAIGLWARDGATISNVIWRDIRGELVEVSYEGRSGQPFYIMAEQRSGQSKLENVLIQNVRLAAPWYSLLETDLPWPLSGITFDDIYLTVLPRVHKDDKKYLFEFDRCADIEFKNVVIDWARADLGQWKGLWPEGAPVEAGNIKQINLKEGK